MWKLFLAQALVAQLEASGEPDEQTTPAEEPAAADRVDEFSLEEAPADFQEAMDTVAKSLAGMWTDFLTRLPLIAVALLVLFLTWGAAKLVGRILRESLRRARLRRSLRDLIQQIVYCTIWVVGLLTAAVVAFPGMTPAKILTVLGLTSIAIGFAFKDIVENFFAGILILWRFPFEPGDFIECNDIVGRVEDTTIRMTTLRQVDGQLVVLPNAQLFKSPVYVITSQLKRRTTIICGVDYTTDLEKARRVLTEAVEQCGTVDRSKPIEIFSQEFARSSVNFEVT